MSIAERGAHADLSQDAVFLGVHGVVARLIVIIKARAMKQSVNAVKQEFLLDTVAALGRLPRGLIGANRQIKLTIFT